MEQAYLEGMSAAMEEVEEELDMRSDELAVQSEELEKNKMQEKILEQAQKLQMKIEKQKELELQIHQDTLRKEARRIAVQTAEDQANREQEIREEAAREMAVRERVIREEAAREIAAQEQAMQAQLAQQTQLWESAGMQQALTAHPQTVPISQTYPVRQTHQTVQPVNYNNYNSYNMNRNQPTGGKEIIASAVEFLKGNGQRTNQPPPANRIRLPNRNQPMVMNQQMTAPNSVTQQRFPQTVPFNGMMSNGMPNNVSNTEPVSGFGLLQSAKSTGTNVLSTLTGVMSPFSGLLGSEIPNMRQQDVLQQGQVVQRPISVARQIPVGQAVPIGQPVLRSGTVAQQPVRNVRQTNVLQKEVSPIPSTPLKVPIPQLSENSFSQYSQNYPVPLPEHNSSVRHTASVTMNKRIPLSVSQETSEEEPDIFVPELPQKPPTRSKTSTKPKRIIEADDEEETSMIRQANFIDR
jgi:hypothetical protein